MFRAIDLLSGDDLKNLLKGPMVIAIDGPTASGKCTLAQRLAKRLGSREGLIRKLVVVILLFLVSLFGSDGKSTSSQAALLLRNCLLSRSLIRCSSAINPSRDIVRASSERRMSSTTWLGRSDFRYSEWAILATATSP